MCSQIKKFAFRSNLRERARDLPLTNNTQSIVRQSGEYLKHGRYVKSRNEARAFTLAEVLITLGIIGVIAAFTIPTLIKNSEEIATVARVKKAYSTLTQAFNQAELNDGEVSTWNWITFNDGTGATNALNILVKYLKISKNCGTEPGCFPADVLYTNLSGGSDTTIDTDTTRAKAILADGTLISTLSRSSDCSDVRGPSLPLSNICGFVFVDTNGFKSPNQFAKDFFPFYITNMELFQ